MPFDEVIKAASMMAAAVRVQAASVRTSLKKIAETPCRGVRTAAYGTARSGVLRICHRPCEVERNSLGGETQPEVGVT